jgi:hypothetical protein
VKKSSISVALALTTLAGSLWAAPVAQAATTSMYGCPYPYVCIYDVSDSTPSSAHIVGKFRDVTSTPQNLVDRKTWTVVNTRADDSALLMYKDWSLMWCMAPRSVQTSTFQAVPGHQTVILDKLQIFSTKDCR